jgi:hypothetical protein
VASSAARARDSRTPNPTYPRHINRAAFVAQRASEGAFGRARYPCREDLPIAAVIPQRSARALVARTCRCHPEAIACRGAPAASVTSRADGPRRVSRLCSS